MRKGERFVRGSVPAAEGPDSPKEARQELAEAIERIETPESSAERVVRLFAELQERIARGEEGRHALLLAQELREKEPEALAQALHFIHGESAAALPKDAILHVRAAQLVLEAGGATRVLMRQKNQGGSEIAGFYHGPMRPSGEPADDILTGH